MTGIITLTGLIWGAFLLDLRSGSTNVGAAFVIALILTASIWMIYAAFTLVMQ